MVVTLGNNIIDAYTGGVQVKAIYSRGVRVWPDLPLNPSSNEFYYTTKDGNPLTFSVSPVSSASGNMLSNTFDAVNGVYVVTFEYGITQISGSAFENMTQLESVVLPSGVDTINSYAFRNSGLTSIVMPGAVVLSQNAFEGCYYLRYITWPSNTGYEKMALGCFRDCISLDTVVVLATTPPLMAQEEGTGSYTQFAGTPATLKILVDGSLVNTYKSAAGWSSYSDKIGSL